MNSIPNSGSSSSSSSYYLKQTSISSSSRTTSLDETQNTNHHDFVNNVQPCHDKEEQEGTDTTSSGTTTPSTTVDVFILLPGKPLDAMNDKLFQEGLAAAYSLYPTEFVHVVNNTGTMTGNNTASLVETTDESLLLNDNKFSVGGYIAAARWMAQHRPSGNFVIVQHSVLLTRAITVPPTCDMETILLKYRCGPGPCGPSSTIMSNSQPVGIRNDSPELALPSQLLWEVYQTTCGPPCHQTHVNDPTTLWHIRWWPLFAHNSILFTARARTFLEPFVARIDALQPGTEWTKVQDMGMERMWGVLSTLMVLQQGPRMTVENDSSSSSTNATTTKVPLTSWNQDPYRAALGDTSLCMQDAGIKRHGRMPSRQV
jgi:hypothetical protein